MQAKLENQIKEIVDYTNANPDAVDPDWTPILWAPAGTNLIAATAFKMGGDGKGRVLLKHFKAGWNEPPRWQTLGWVDEKILEKTTKNEKPFVAAM